MFVLAEVESQDSGETPVETFATKSEGCSLKTSDWYWVVWTDGFRFCVNGGSLWGKKNSNVLYNLKYNFCAEKNALNRLTNFNVSSEKKCVAFLRKKYFVWKCSVETFSWVWASTEPMNGKYDWLRSNCMTGRKGLSYREFWRIQDRSEEEGCNSGWSELSIKSMTFSVTGMSPLCAVR